MRKINLANKVTILRIAAIVPLVFFLSFGGRVGKVLSLLIFIVASFSDWLDGWLARKMNEVSNTGKIIDPVADKILVYSALICFVYLHLIPFWMMIILMGRDFLVMALRIQLAYHKVVLAANFVAKGKTVAEYVAILLIFVSLLWRKGSIQVLLSNIAWASLGIAVLLAVISGIQYALKGRNNYLATDRR